MDNQIEIDTSAVLAWGRTSSTLHGIYGFGFATLLGYLACIRDQDVLGFALLNFVFWMGFVLWWTIFRKLFSLIARQVAEHKGLHELIKLD